MRKNIIEVLIRARDQSAAAMQAAGKNVSAFATRIKSLGPMITAAAAAMAYATARIITSTAKWGDEIAKNAKRLEVTTEFLSEMEHAAKLSGAEMANLNAGLRRMARSASDASFGLMTQKRAFDSLGVSVTDSTGRLKSVEALFTEVADKISRMDDATRKAAVAQEIFGRGGTELLVLLNQGADGLKKMREEAVRLGGSLSPEQAKKFEEFADSVTRIQTAWKGLLIEFSSGATERMVDTLNNLAEIMGRYKREGLWGGIKELFAQSQMQSFTMDDWLASQGGGGGGSGAGGGAEEIVAAVQEIALTAEQIEKLKEQQLALEKQQLESIRQRLALLAQENDLRRQGYEWCEKIGTWTKQIETEMLPEKFHMAGEEIQQSMSMAAVYTANVFEDMFMAVTLGAENMAERIKQIMLRLMAQLLVKGILGWLTGGVGFLPFNQGGEFVPHARSGLEVIGGQYHKDTIPAVVSRGEVVMPSPTVDRLNRFLGGQGAQGAGGPMLAFNPLFFSGSRHDAFRAARFMEDRLAIHQGYLVPGSL